MASARPRRLPESVAIRDDVARPRSVALAVFAALAAVCSAPSAGAYGWPVAPFDVQHPVRAHVGDPRTRYYEPYDPERAGVLGSFTFHNGVDIAALPHASVYPVVTGVVTQVRGQRIVVRSGASRTFQYIHVEPRVVAGRRVVARKTVLGTVEPVAGHVHLTETAGGRVVNPLLPGHLAPYADTTKPRIAGVHARAASGKRFDVLQLSGAVSLAVEAFDVPAIPVPGSWSGLPITPALVTWSLRAESGAYVVPKTVAVDFRHTLPFNRDFWRVYAPGTFQNKPRYGGGRYVFRLTPGLLDTRAFPDGRYRLEVGARDVRGNRSSRVVAVSVCNGPAACAAVAKSARPH